MKCQDLGECLGYLGEFLFSVFEDIINTDIISSNTC